MLRALCLRNGKDVVPLVWEFRETPYGGTLWFRYNIELTANTTTPPGMTGKRSGSHSPSQFGQVKKQRERTDGFGDGHDLRAVKGQVTERPNDWMNLLHDVEGDGHNAAGVLTNGYTPGRNDHKMLCPNKRQHQAAERNRSPTHPGHVWLGSNRISSVGS